MEVILKKDVENLGFKDDVIAVKPGYARNFLIPQGFATLATDSAKKVLAENLRQRAHKEAKMIEDAKKMAEGMKNAAFKLAVKVGKDGKLFGSLNNADLAESMTAMGFAIDKKFIQIVGGTIKATGKYTAKVRLHREVNIEVEFDVVGEA